MSPTQPTRTTSDPRASAALDRAVRERYSEGATRQVKELCCSASYDPARLAAIPEDVLARDYGCGDPSRHLRAGETVLDLGSGTGKICFIAAQVVGAAGRVIGVDQNDDMLAVARAAAPVVARNIGYANVSFLKGRIEDLALDREALDRHLAAQPVRSEADFVALERHLAEQRATAPLVADASVDVVVSNCVLNLVLPEAKQQLFREIFRVLKRGGRAVISDITCDEELPAHRARDPELWSGCVAGAFREDAFLQAFEAAGFHGIEILERAAQPWQVVDGVEFRSVTVQAWKGKQGPCLEQHQAVIYRGPWKQVLDDDGHTLERGQRMAVCGKTYGLLTSAPYASEILGVPPHVSVAAEDARPFACTGSRVRTAQETKAGGEADAAPAGTPASAPAGMSAPGAPCCEPGACC